MNKDDSAILRNVQKNIEMAMKAIDTIEDKVSDHDMALLLAKTTQKYSDLHQRTVSSLVEENEKPYKGNIVEDMMLVGGINTNTLLDTSTSHIAELMIKGSNMGITDLTKTLNHHKDAGHDSREIANELMDLEKYNMEEYKKYL